MPASRKIRRPPATFSATGLPAKAFAGLSLLRVHSKDHPAICFRKSVNHRFSHPDAPAGCLYLGEAIETCLWECFGDELLDGQARLSLGRWQASHLSQVSSPSPFRICDLTDEAVRLAVGVDLASLMSPDLSIPQAWGLAMQTHSANLDGLRYLSRLNAQPSIVLFERPGIAAKLSAALMGPLADVPEADQFLMQQSIGLV